MYLLDADRMERGTPQRKTVYRISLTLVKRESLGDEDGGGGGSGPQRAENPKVGAFRRESSVEVQRGGLLEELKEVEDESDEFTTVHGYMRNFRTFSTGQLELGRLKVTRKHLHKEAASPVTEHAKETPERQEDAKETPERQEDTKETPERQKETPERQEDSKETPERQEDSKETPERQEDTKETPERQEETPERQEETPERQEDSKETPERQEDTKETPERQEETPERQEETPERQEDAQEDAKETPERQEDAKETPERQEDTKEDTAVQNCGVDKKQRLLKARSMEERSSGPPPSNGRVSAASSFPETPPLKRPPGLLRRSFSFRHWTGGELLRLRALSKDKHHSSSSCIGRDATVPDAGGVEAPVASSPSRLTDPTRQKSRTLEVGAVLNKTDSMSELSRWERARGNKNRTLDNSDLLRLASEKDSPGGGFLLRGGGGRSSERRLVRFFSGIFNRRDGATSTPTGSPGTDHRALHRGKRRFLFQSSTESMNGGSSEVRSLAASRCQQLRCLSRPERCGATEEEEEDGAPFTSRGLGLDEQLGAPHTRLAVSASLNASALDRRDQSTFMHFKQAQCLVRDDNQFNSAVSHLSAVMRLFVLLHLLTSRLALLTGSSLSGGDAFVNSQEWTLSRTVPELKVGIVGNLASGKSALVHRYLTGTYVQEESPEGGRFKKEIVVDGQSHLLLIRDEGGPPEAQSEISVTQHRTNICKLRLTSRGRRRITCSLQALLLLSFSEVRCLSSLCRLSSDAISSANPRVIDDSRARKLSNDLKRCTYYETCATYGLNVERVFQDGE
ncbi:Arf-GAP with GTPase, ANK repeat and PH domain-containing protein 1 [Collichthys lucidus]|uniref:Arf-GAP with GTPase, ANK repeat and PH domain-containing protein 1 n=1 Tax=Collichthys lucidus TaxID=240159 RepID=A0A4U5TZ57_COLLU|nr:Arf-GAP with GTPase, ANK repeat and PH domain-containing protein 1 [Collichthys lucidus]